MDFHLFWKSWRESVRFDFPFNLSLLINIWYIASDTLRFRITVRRPDQLHISYILLLNYTPERCSSSELNITNRITCNFSLLFFDFIFSPPPKRIDSKIHLFRSVPTSSLIQIDVDVMSTIHPSASLAVFAWYQSCVVAIWMKDILLSI